MQKSIKLLLFVLFPLFGYGQIQTINVGTSPNDRTGDPVRTAFQKTNANFVWIGNTFITSAIAASTYVPQATTITINGTTYDLSANRTWTITSLPTQTGNSGKYLQTDGSNASWQTVISGVTSVFGRSGAILAVGGDYTAAQVTGAVADTRTIATTSPLSGGGDLSTNRTLTIANAVDDGGTKGAASFTAADFNATAGNISIDYTNGQAATGSVKGFLTSTDWTTFNAKQAALGFTAENSANKDATGGYVGLTLFKINFKNAANTFTSFFTNSNTSAITYTFQNRNGTVADDTDLATKQATLVSGANIKTINSSSLLGSGNIVAGDALIANPLSQFASTTSAQLASTLSNETGTGSVVFSDNPTFTNLVLPSGTTAPTQSANDNSTKVANTTYVDTGLGLKAERAITFNTQTADYTIQTSDFSSLTEIQMNKATAINLTLPTPTSLSIPTGRYCYVRRIGAGTLTVVASGSTITSSAIVLTDAGLNVQMTLFATSSTTWSLQNGSDLSAVRQALGFIQRTAIHTDATTSYAATNSPTTERVFAALSAHIFRVDLSLFRQVRLTCRVVTASASVNTPRIYLKYSTDGVNFNTIIGAGTVASGDAISLFTAGIGLISNWIDIPSPAKGDIWIGLYEIGGDAAADPAISAVYMDARY